MLYCNRIDVSETIDVKQANQKIAILIGIFYTSL